MEMRKPIRCRLGFHAWEPRKNEDGETYQACTRCGVDGNRLSPSDYLSGGFS